MRKTKNAALFVCSVFLGTLGSSCYAQVSNPINATPGGVAKNNWPAGSYRKTCKSCTWMKSFDQPLFSCLCKDWDQKYKQTSITGSAINKCWRDNREIENINGKLACDRKRK